MSGNADTAPARITKNSRSPIWRFFEPVSKNNTKCLLCESIYRNSGNTTNLIDHLRRRHKSEHQQFSELLKNQASGGGGGNAVSAETITEVIETNSAEIPIALENIKYETESSEVLEVDEANTTELIGTSELTEEIEHNELDDSAHVEDGQVLGDVDKVIFESDDGHHDVQVCKIVPLPHARSEVWTYFGFVADQDGQILDRSKVVCRLCSSSFCYSGNTTNFYSHLKSMHSEIQMRSVPSKNARVSVKRTYSSMNDDANDTDYLNDATSAAVAISQDASLAEDDSIPNRSRSDLIHVDDITQTIVDFIVTDCRPLAITQGRGFQRMLRLLAPGYSLPDKAKLALAVRRKYDQMRKDREQGALDRLNAVDY